MKLFFVDVIDRLYDFWKKQGCTKLEPYDLEVGAGTFHPATVLYPHMHKNWKVCYVQKSRRPGDGRFNKNPMRLQSFHQFQVVIKPIPENIKSIFLSSLLSIGLTLRNGDLQFYEDNWKSPTLGSSGLGWEVRYNGLEITQFTYFQKLFGIEINEKTCEIAYGLERLLLCIQGIKSFQDIRYDQRYKYGDLYSLNEVEFSEYNIEVNDADFLVKNFLEYERESKKLILKNLPLVAYEYVIKLSHLFNILEAKGVLSNIERESYIDRIRKISRSCYQSFNAKYC